MPDPTQGDESDRDVSWIHTTESLDEPGDPSPDKAKQLFGAALDADKEPQVTDVGFIESVAQDFPQLDILALLGKGGMGAVFQGASAVTGSLRRAQAGPSQSGKS